MLLQLDPIFYISISIKSFILVSKNIYLLGVHVVMWRGGDTLLKSFGSSPRSEGGRILNVSSPGQSLLCLSQ